MHWGSLGVSSVQGPVTVYMSGQHGIIASLGVALKPKIGQIESRHLDSLHTNSKLQREHVKDSLLASIHNSKL